MRKTIISLSTCLLLLTTALTAYGQDADVKPDANEVPTGSLQGTSNSDVSNVDFFTGASNTSIPIYSYSVNGIDASISLGYSGKGIRVDDLASNVGLGWGLNAGGSIRRTVYGTEDEIKLPSLTNSTNNNEVAPARDGRLTIYASGDQYESEPDLFEADFGGRSIKFTLSYNSDTHEFNAAVSPKSEITVKVYGVVSNGNGGTIEKLFTNINTSSYLYNRPNDWGQHQDYGYFAFDIIDEKQNVFHFERGDYEGKFYQPFGPGYTDMVYYATDKWDLTKITTNNNAVLKFEYTPFVVSYASYKDESVTETFKHSDGNTTIPADIAVARTYGSYDGYMTSISKITYPNGVIASFNYGASNRCDLSDEFQINAIESITLTNGYANYKNNLTYKLNYAYFGSPGIEDDNDGTYGSGAPAEIPYNSGNSPCSDIYATYDQSNKYTNPEDLAFLGSLCLRLKLKSIDRIGLDNAQTERAYTFDYNSVQLPPRLSSKKDYYGYYNGKTPTTLSVTKGFYSPSGGGWSNAYVTHYYNLSVPKHHFQPNGSTGTSNLVSGTTNIYSINDYYGIDKTPDATLAQANILTKITNASGGTTQFTYTQPSAYAPAQPSYTVPANPTSGSPDGANEPPVGINVPDGLDIHEIYKSDGFNKNNATVTTYTFTDGQPLYQGGYYWYPNEVVSLPPDFIIHATSRTYKNSFVNGRTFFHGSNHGYTNADVVTFAANPTSGFNPLPLGKVRYTFMNVIGTDENGSQNSAVLMHNMTIYDHNEMPIRIQEYRLGVLLQKKAFDINSNILSTDDYTYNDVATFGKIYSDGGGQKFPGTTDVNSYNLFTCRLKLPSDITTTYYQGSNAMVQSTDYIYDTYDNIISSAVKDSKGDLYTTKFLYNYTDLTANPSLCTNCQPISAANNVANGQFLMSTFNFKKNTSGEWLIGQTTHLSTGSPNPYLFNKSFKLATASPVPVSTLNSNWPLLTTEMTNDAYGVGQHNVIQRSFPVSNKTGSFIWDQRIGQKVAEATNCAYTEMAATSFEGDFKFSFQADENRGNWSFDPSGVTLGSSSDKPMTGHYYFNLCQSTHTIKSEISLTTDKKYLLTFWATDPPAVVQITGTANTGTLQIISMVQQAQVGNWKLYSAYLTGGGNPVFIEGVGTTSIKIDELRLHPVDATMKTWTYEPLLGPASVCDENNNISYLEYDNMGRQSVVRDNNGKIIRMTQQVLQGADN